jgi:hypothetical protein
MEFHESTIEPEQEHDCPQRPQEPDSAEGPRPPPAYWGEAITQIGLLGGRWWAISGREPPEYATQIRYCPWCGIDLMNESPQSPIQRRQRRRIPDCRQENELSREEMAQFGARGGDAPPLRRRRPRGASGARPRDKA